LPKKIKLPEAKITEYIFSTHPPKRLALNFRNCFAYGPVFELGKNSESFEKIRLTSLDIFCIFCVMSIASIPCIMDSPSRSPTYNPESTFDQHFAVAAGIKMLYFCGPL